MASSTWESLPPALLGRCLRLGSPSAEELPHFGHRQGPPSAMFATCKSFTKAMLLPDPDLEDPLLRVYVDNLNPGLTGLLRLVEEGSFRLVVCVKGQQGQEDNDEEQEPVSLQPLLGLWQEEGVILRGVRKVICSELLFDTDGLFALLPNLQDLSLDGCQVPEGMLPLSGCNQLQKLALDMDAMTEPAPSTTPAAWLLQLANLPSLTSLAIDTRYHPTSFLPLLADQLTHLQLGGMYDPDVDPAIAQAAPAHTVQLTKLRSLQVSGWSAQQLASLSTLPHLQQLTVEYMEGDGLEGAAAAISALLPLPHLTSLTLPYIELQQSYADQPCSWRELTLTYVASLETLARLPLQSVSVLRLYGLELPANLTAGDVARVVANLTRGQPTLVRGLPSHPHVRGLPMHPTWAGAEYIIYMEMAEGEVSGEQQAASCADRLLAAAPLMPQDITSVTVMSSRNEPRQWSANAATVAALQQVMPHSITSIELNGCFTSPSFWPQLAISFPKLKKLCITPTNVCSPLAVMSYYCAACAAHRLPGMPQVADVEFEGRFLEALDDGFTPEVARRWEGSFRELNDHLRLLGLSAKAYVRSAYTPY